MNGGSCLYCPNSVELEADFIITVLKVRDIYLFIGQFLYCCSCLLGWHKDIMAGVDDTKVQEQVESEKIMPSQQEEVEFMFENFVFIYWKLALEKYVLKNNFITLVLLSISSQNLAVDSIYLFLVGGCCKEKVWWHYAQKTTTHFKGDF